jgi:hypothetical protein
MIARLPLRFTGFVAAAVAGAVALVSAQSFNVKVGLWEVTATVQAGGAPPVDTSAMTPEQRAQVEAMMKNMTAKPHTNRTCITREKLDKNPFDNGDGDACKHTVLQRTATVYAFKDECTGEDGATTNDARFVATTPEAVTGTVKIVRNRGGKVTTINSQITGKFVGSSCGDVK